MLCSRTRLSLRVNRTVGVVAPWRPPHLRTRFSSQRYRAQPLSWEIPKRLFPRPENFFPRPERIFGEDTFRDLVLKQGEAVKEFPWEYAIFISVVILIIAEVVVKPYEDSDSSQSDSSGDEEILPVVEESREIEAPPTLTEEQAAIRAMKRIHFQTEQNKNLLILACVAVVLLWMVGFLNTPHPFLP